MTALKRVPYISEHELDVGSIWPSKNTLSLLYRTLLSVLICLKAIVWSWIK